MDYLAMRARNVSESATLASAQKARQLKESGYDVISLTVGEPDFFTPTHIKQAAIHAIETGRSDHYTAATGIPQLKEAIIAAHQTLDNLHYTSDQVFVGTGAKHVLYVLFQVLLNEGDEVLLPAPYWVSYSEQIKLAGGVPVVVYPSQTGFKVTVSDLAQAITERTKIVLLNSPNNPSGAVYTTEELRSLAEWAVSHELLIISDEIYFRLVYGDYPTASLPSLSEAIKRQTILVSGVSKTYAMTGWRIGYALAERREIIQAMAQMVSHETGNPSAACQYAALEAYAGDQATVARMRRAFAHRLDVFYELIAAIPGFELERPQGAFYLFPNVAQAARMTGYETVADFADALLTEAYVAVVTGDSFGYPDNIRLSYAGDDALLIEAARRIHQFVQDKIQ